MRKRFKDLKPDDIVLVGQVDFSNESEVAGNLDVRHLANGPGDPQAVLTIDPTDYFWRGDGQWAIPGDGDGCPLYCGPGEPEGVITSVVGGIYEQDDRVSTSHPLFVKRTGTGNTGWRGWNGLSGAGLYSFEIGDNAVVSAQDALGWGRAVAIGAAAVDGIAIGHGATLDDAGTGRDGAGGAIALGATRAVNYEEINIGSRNLGTGGNNGAYSCIYIGHDIVHRVGNHGKGTILIGDLIETDVTGTFAAQVGIGYGVYLGGGNHVVIGESASANDADSPIVGLPVATFGVAIGESAQMNGDCVVAVGHHSSTRADFCVALGPHAIAGYDASTVSCVAVGRFSFALGLRSTAVGDNATVNVGHDYSIALGRNAATTAANQLMIGDVSAPINEVLFNGRNTSGAGIALTFRPAPASGTNQNGGDQTVAGGPGTGTGTPGQILFKVATPAGSGTTVQTLATKGRFTKDGFSLESSLALPLATVTTNTTLDATHHTVMVNSASSRTITLPTAASAYANGSGRVYVVKRIGAGAVTVQGDGAELIEAANTFPLATLYDAITLQSDGTQWWII